MKWTRLGRIFDPREHALPSGCKEFAQSPQALVCDGFVRVYFATRAVDPANGKYLSHVAFADFSRDLRRVLRVNDRPVIALGGLGSFDEHGIFPFSVFRQGDEVRAYTCGWSRRVSVSVETGIGLAASRDGGLTFERRGAGPVLSASLHEPCLVGDGFVRVYNGGYHMWYIFGTGWHRAEEGATPERVYKIGHAVSSDGVRWQKEEGRQIIPDRLGPDECQALPTEIRIGEEHHLFFCHRRSTDFRTNPARAYRLGHAVSRDLLHWTRDDDLPGLAPAPGDWDAGMMCYPNVLECDGKVYLLYNGDQFGRHGFGAAVLS